MKNISLEDYCLNILDNAEARMFMKPAKPPKPVGYWVIGADEMGMWGTELPVYAKPTDEQIENHYRLLGWSYTEKYI